jgi:predicted TIM-barrel fold metal-dependent hydrolase
VPLIDINEGVKEIKRAAKQGMKGVYVFVPTVNGIRYGDPYYDPFWAEAEDLEMPNEYFKRQCFISGEPDETTIPAMAGLIGADKLVWGSDHPHTEGHPNSVEEIKCAVAPLPALDQALILGENAAELYDINSC